MENYTVNENSLSTSKNGSKPYERKVRISQVNQRKYNTEEEDEKEDEKIKFQNEIQYNIENGRQEQMNNEQEEEIQEYIQDEFKKNELFQDDENQDYKNYQNIKNNIKSKEYIKEDNFQTGEYPGISGNTQGKKYFKSELDNVQYIQNEDDNIQNEEYDDRYQYIEDGGGEGEGDENIQENLNNNYKSKYKYKKIIKNENEIEHEDVDNIQNEEGEENEELNEEEDAKDDIDNIDLQEIKKKPGRILHQSTQETFDEEGNRIITRKTIKEFRHMTGGVRIRNIQNEKEKIEYERYTSNYGRNKKKVQNARKTHSTYKSDNRGDRLYLLAQLAKLKNDAEKNKMKKKQIFSSQSPIIIHESNGYDVYENQNSIFSNEIEPNSFEEEMYERNNYRNNYGTVDNNYNIINNQEYRERFFYPNQQTKYSSNGMQLQEEYFGENDSTYNRRDIPSPIGYIATYSSGSEDNEEIGKSYEQYTHKNYRTTHPKNKIDKNIFKKEGELIKKTEVVYELEDPNEYIGFNERKSKRHNLSTNLIKAQIDTSKSDKRDFQSPDREFGAGSERFRKVTMAMISSLGPTCEDRKITRKMRSEVGGVVDLRQELNPVNTYKIKKFQRFGYNLNKEVNPKTKLEGAKIIQYWWRKLKEKKIMMIKYIKIVKIQSVIRSFLVRKKIITTRIIYYFYEILENILNNHYKKEIFKLFKISDDDKRKKKLVNIIQIITDKNNKQNKIKYFYKLKYITDLLKNKGSTTTTTTTTTNIKVIDQNKSDINKKVVNEEIKETTITEEMYIKYIKEKYSNNNKSQRINELSIDKKIKKPYEISNKTKYEIQKTKKELIDEQTQDDINKKIYKEIGTQKEKEKMLITNEKPINYIKNKPATNEIGIGVTPEINKIESGESISYYNKQTTKEIPKNEIITKDKISLIYNKPSTKEEGIDGGSININEISEKKSLLFPKTIKEKVEIIKEEKPEKIMKMDSTEISIIKQKKEFKESSTQKEKTENEINKLNDINFLYQKPKTNEQGTGGFSLSEGIDKLDINYIKPKKEYKDSETTPIIQNMELSKDNLSIIKPVKKYVESDSQYRDPNLPTDKNKEILKLLNKKIIKEKLYLSSFINRWRKIALSEKIKKDIDDKKIEKLKNIFPIKDNFLKKYIKRKFEEFVSVCHINIPEKTMEPIQYDNFNIIDTRPENKKVQLDEFIIQRKEKPELQIDKKDEYNILKIQKNYKDEETQKTMDLDENKVNTQNVENKIIQNELINIIKAKKETIESGTSPKHIETKIISNSQIFYNKIPKKFEPEPKQGEYFTIVDTRPNNEKEKINDIHLKPKEKEPLKIKNLEKLDIFGKPKIMEKKPEIIDKGTQNEIPKNEINNKNEISFLYKKKEMKDEYSQNEVYKPVISNNRLNIINKIEKCDQSEQIGSWESTIKKNESINFISNIPKKEQKIIIPNDIKKTVSLEIIKNKKELHDQEIQYIPDENKIEAQEIEIKGNKPLTKENSSQYIAKKPIICKSNQYSILMSKKKELINKYLINKNTMTILSKKKALTEKGQQYDMPKEYKKKEIIIGNNIKRGVTQKIIEILEEIWIKKEKHKFINNCKEISRETMIKRELLRMALLRWRFIKGYGGDRYGVIYDRDGKEIGKKEGLVNDVSIQNNLDEEINNTKLKNKLLQNKISKQKPVYIKSNIIQKQKIMQETGTGDEPNHIIESRVDKITCISYNRRIKPKKNIISNKNYFKINKVDKKLKDEGTYMAPKFIKIVKGNQLLIINKDNKIKNVNMDMNMKVNIDVNINRRRDLLMQIISKSMIREKYVLNDYFSKWFKKTTKLIEYENRYKYRTKKVQPRISKTEKFEIITKKPKREKSAGPNKIVRGAKIEFKNKTLKKDIGIITNMPNRFKIENLKTNKINNDMYKSYKKPIIVRQIKGEKNYTISEENVNREITTTTTELGTPIGREIVDEINIRITEIFVKFLKSRTSPKCILRKYLSIWHRNSQYMALLENARIISIFCKSKLKSIFARKNWKKLYKKYLFTIKQYNIMKIIKKIKIRKIKIIRLIRMTRLITIFNKRKFLHYIMMYWLIYTITTIKKRNQIKILYENMLTTYVSMADDIFGKNKKNNPSIQDCMFEIIDTDKYQVKELEDVPIAKIYYSKKNGEKKIITNIKYIEKEIEDEKKCDFYKEMTKKYYSPNKYNTYKTDTETKNNETKSEKRAISYKGIYQNNNNITNAQSKSSNINIQRRYNTNNIINTQTKSSNINIENKYNTNNIINTQTKSSNINTESKYNNRSNYNTSEAPGIKEGFAKYTYKGFKRTENIGDNNSSKGSVATFKRRNNNNNSAAEKNDNSNISISSSSTNNRYAHLKNEEKEKENYNNKSYSYKSRLIKNSYYNNIDKQKSDEKKKEEDKSYYKSKYLKTYYNNEKDKINDNDNDNKYQNRIKTEVNTYNSRRVYSSNRFNNNEGK